MWIFLLNLVCSSAFINIYIFFSTLVLDFFFLSKLNFFSPIENDSNNVRGVCNCRENFLKKKLCKNKRHNSFSFLPVKTHTIAFLLRSKVMNAIVISKMTFIGLLKNIKKTIKENMIFQIRDNTCTKRERENSVTKTIKVST
jgi:hypothetical protein